jgi:Zn-dependent M28 family amino/carboxypeptidase
VEAVLAAKLTMLESPIASSTRLRAWLERIVGERHHRSSRGHHAATADLIRETLVSQGWAVNEQVVPGPFGPGTNIIGRRSGTGRGIPTWILGAHYDTVPGSPGADDNGIAVAGLLEAAALLRKQVLRDSVEIVAWDLEERQTLKAGSRLGSKEMARRVREDGRAIAGVFALEMIGLCRREEGSQSFPSGFGLLFPEVVRHVEARGMRGDFITAVGDGEASRMLKSLEGAARKVNLPCVTVSVTGAARLIPHFYRSDHARFWAVGVPAVMITDTAEFRSGHYHRPSDTIETIDFDFAAHVIMAVVDALVELAGGTADPAPRGA